MLSGNKPSPEPMLTQIYASIWKPLWHKRNHLRRILSRKWWMHFIASEYSHTTAMQTSFQYSQNGCSIPNISYSIFPNDSVRTCKGTSLLPRSIGLCFLTFNIYIITVSLKLLSLSFRREARIWCQCFHDMRSAPYNQQYYYTILRPCKTRIHMSEKCCPWD